jgi:hypothetical protein
MGLIVSNFVRKAILLYAERKIQNCEFLVKNTMLMAYWNVNVQIGHCLQ